MKRIVGAAAALLVAALSACSGSSTSPEPQVPPASSKAPSTIPTTGTPNAGATGGLDVRYLDDDGTVKTVKVRSFPR